MKDLAHLIIPLLLLIESLHFINSACTNNKNWIETISSTASCNPVALTIDDSDNIYIASNINGILTYFKTDSFGTINWEEKHSDSANTPSDIKYSVNDNQALLIVGSSTGSTISYFGSSDV